MNLRLELAAIKQLQKEYQTAVSNKANNEIIADLHNRLSLLREMVVNAIIKAGK